MRSRCLIALMVLAVWVVLDPIFMAFNACDGMDTTCAVSCSLGCYGGPALTSMAAVPHLTYPLVQLSERPPTLMLKYLVFPP